MGVGIGHPSSENTEQKHKISVFDGRLIVLLITLFNLIIFGFVRYRINQFPRPLKQGIKSPKDKFYEANARVHLEHFALHGPRVVGSEANEIHAYSYILSELNKIKKDCLPSKEMIIDEQNVTGTFDIAFLSEFVSVYRNIKNIAVKLSSETGSKQSLLFSCHFDSIMDSPG